MNIKFDTELTIDENEIPVSVEASVSMENRWTGHVIEDVEIKTLASGIRLTYSGLDNEDKNRINNLINDAVFMRIR